MNVQHEFLSKEQELGLAFIIEKELDDIRPRGGQLRNRILRFGWDYLNPNKWIGVDGWSLPGWVVDVGGIHDSVTINEYTRGQIISPHIDSAAFGDVSILSLLADVVMRFVSPTGEVRDFTLPRRSVAVMSGKFRTDWNHETLPLESDLRYSMVYRKKL